VEIAGFFADAPIESFGIAPDGQSAIVTGVDTRSDLLIVAGGRCLPGAVERLTGLVQIRPALPRALASCVSRTDDDSSDMHYIGEAGGPDELRSDGG
jgi:hypothetical protein